MKPIDQLEKNDCVRACVASIMELSLEDVPHFVAESGKSWRIYLFNWLRAKDLAFVELSFPIRNIWLSKAYGIACGKSPRYLDGSMEHACIWQDWKVVHDPHMSRGGLIGEPKTLIFITK